MSIKWLEIENKMVFFYDQSITINKGTKTYKKVKELIEKPDCEQKLAKLLFNGKHIARSSKKKFAIEKENKSKKIRKTYFDKIDLRNLTAKKIVEKVYVITGQKITNAIKDKTSIVNKATKILQDYGLKVKI